MKKQYKCKRVKFLEIMKQEHFCLQSALEATNTDLDVYEMWLSKYPWFEATIEIYNKQKILYIESLVMKQIRNGNTKATQLWLTEFKKRNDKIKW